MTRIQFSYDATGNHAPMFRRPDVSARDARKFAVHLKGRTPNGNQILPPVTKYISPPASNLRFLLIEALPGYKTIIFTGTTITVPLPWHYYLLRRSEDCVWSFTILFGREQLYTPEDTLSYSWLTELDVDGKPVFYCLDDSNSTTSFTAAYDLAQRYLLQRLDRDKLELIPAYEAAYQIDRLLPDIHNLSLDTVVNAQPEVGYTTVSEIHQMCIDDVVNSIPTLSEMIEKQWPLK